MTVAFVVDAGLWIGFAVCFGLWAAFQWSALLIGTYTLGTKFELHW